MHGSMNVKKLKLQFRCVPTLFWPTYKLRIVFCLFYSYSLLLWCYFSEHPVDMKNSNKCLSQLQPSGHLTVTTTNYNLSTIKVCVLYIYIFIYIYIYIYTAARGSAVGWDTALKAGRSRVRFPMVSLEFFIDIILPAALWPWGWLSL